MPCTQPTGSEPAGVDPARRALMGMALGAPVAAVAVLCAVPAAPAAAGTVAAAPLPEAPPRGYHRTAHVDACYARLRY